MEVDKYLNFDVPCPRAEAEFDNLLDSKEILDMYQTHQKIHDLIIPEWVDTYWDEMSVIAFAIFRTFYSSYVQLKLRMGPFLEIISKNLMDKVNGQNPHLKVVMNSAHDLNVAALLLALNFTDMPRPPYCATLLIELHEMSDASMAVRLLYMNSTEPLREVEDPHVLVMYGCTEFCPLETFIKSYQHLIPDNWSEECQLKN
ncbi:Lysosomal acid phosphatase like protein [Argiope bruennichi]|uniref:acid phosphatase n=1 Tax=Argiope bruennichi TaxID=94029 RepID=A0A8T0FYV6_ARGBR|nr:Lysosomal acid phosphatase like protein [Argiope bruennichi]